MGSADPDEHDAGPRAGVRLTGSATPPLAELPGWVRLFRAPNPGPMTLTGTNSWLLGDPGACLVVDPGPDDEGHLAALAAQRPALTLITHGHPDHIGGLPRWRTLVDAPIRAVAAPAPGATPAVRSGPGTPDDTTDAGHRPSGAAGPSGVGVAGPSEPVADGDTIELGALRVQVLATPGHTTDSACFLVRNGADQVLLTGDTVLGAGTTVVMWPDGDLGAYLASLARLREIGAGIPALPGHGPALADCAAAADFYLAHRYARLDQVRAALADGARDVDGVLARVYPTIAAEVRPAAELTVRAQLGYLRDWEHNPPPEPLDTT